MSEELSKRERFEKILVNREASDRPLVSAWRHFIEAEQDSGALAAATIQFQQENDWDFVKINPRTTYYAEVWGNKYNYDNYDGVVPAVSKAQITGTSDLSRIVKQSVEAPPLQEQLDVIKRVRAGLATDIPILQTVFSPLAVLEYLAGHRTLAAYRPAERSATPLPDLFAAEPAVIHSALEAITDTLIDYIKAALQSGADGIFYAVLGLARDGYLTSEEYEQFGKAYDLKLLEAISPAVVILHTCGPDAHPERFTDYPISALHWADLADGNLSLEEGSELLGTSVAMGGVDERLFANSELADVIAEQAARAIASFNGKPFVLSAGCGVPLNATKETLRALRNAVE